MNPSQIVQSVQKPLNAAAASGSGAFISFFAKTLPVIQWTAASLAILVSLIAIAPVVKRTIDKFRK